MKCKGCGGTGQVDNWVMGLGNSPGISGFMAGCVAQMVSAYHSRGEDFRKSWNKPYYKITGQEDKGGVVNPAILNIKEQLMTVKLRECIDLKGFRKCRKCNKKYHVIDSFYPRKQRGVLGIDNYCKKCRNILNKEYRHSPKGKVAIKNKTIHFKKNNPTKINAYNKVQTALRNGSLIRKPCAFCQKANTHAHHEDYNKPLKVIWVCDIHHRFIHKYKTIISKESELIEVKA